MYVYIPMLLQLQTFCQCLTGQSVKFKHIDEEGLGVSWRFRCCTGKRIRDFFAQ